MARDITELFNYVGQKGFFIIDYKILYGRVSSAKNKGDDIILTMIDVEKQEEYEIQSNIFYSEPWCLDDVKDILKEKLDNDILRLQNLKNEMFPPEKEEGKNRDPNDGFNIEDFLKRYGVQITKHGFYSVSPTPPGFSSHKP